MTFNQQTKPVSGLIPIKRFLDDYIFATEDGGYGIAFILSGIDSEGMTRAALDQGSDRLCAALNCLPETAALYQYTLRRRGYELPRSAGRNQARNDFLDKTAHFGEVSLFWSIYVPGKRSKKKRDWVTHSNRALRQLRHASSLLRESVSDLFGLTVLDSSGSAAMFSYLLRLEPHLAVRRLRSHSNVDRQLAGVPIEWHHDYLKIGHRYGQAFSLLKTPRGTRPNLFGDLLKIDIDFVLCTIWRPRSSGVTRKEVARQEGVASLLRHSALTALNHLSKGSGVPDKSAASIAADEKIGDLGSVLKDLDKGRQYGQFSLFGLVHSTSLDDVREAMPSIHKVFKEPGEAEIMEETLGAMSAYYAMFPGNQQFDVRRKWLQDRHYAHLSAIYAPVTGQLESDSLPEYLAIYETRDRAPFFFDPYHNGLRGLLVIGAPRRGKSMNGNFIVDCEQKFNGFTYIFDIGRSYEHTVRTHGGTVLDLGIHQPLGNPFQLEPTEENIQFLFRLFRVLIVQGGVILSAQDENELAHKIRQMYMLGPSVRRLRHLTNLLPERIAVSLAKWTGNGVYGQIFDNDEPLPCLGHLQVFEFENVDEEHRDLIEPSLFWLTRLINNVVHNPSNLGAPKHILFDELWKQIQSPQLLDMVIKSLKTGGKHLSGVTLLTHTLDDLGENARLIKNACPMVMFLGGDTFDREQYGSFFGLNERELDEISELGSRELALKTPELFKVLRLNLDPASYQLYSTKPKDRLDRARSLAAAGR